MNLQSFVTAITPLLWNVLQVIIDIGAPVALVYGVRWLDTATKAAKYAAARQFVHDTVLKAEAYFKTTDGAAKKAWVMKAIQVWLDSKKWKLNATEIDYAIESTVYSDTTHSVAVTSLIQVTGPASDVQITKTAAG